MKPKAILAATISAALLSGCATAPKDIAPTYVSSGPYENMSCKQLQDEAEFVSQRAAEAYGIQKDNAKHDAALTGVGVVLFWPALFFNKGDGADAAQVARMKGEMDVIERVDRQKNCGIKFVRPA